MKRFADAMFAGIQADVAVVAAAVDTQLFEGVEDYADDSAWIDTDDAGVWCCFHVAALERDVTCDTVSKTLFDADAE